MTVPVSLEGGGKRAMARNSAVIDHVDMALPTILERAQIAEKLGADGLWVSQFPGQRDIGMLLAALAANTERVTFGPAVLPVYASPPGVMAQASLTLDEMSGGRLILGLGRGHRLFGEWMLGANYYTSTEPMREYLTIVKSLIRQGEVSENGRWFRGATLYSAPRRPALPVYVGCFGRRMLELAAELADGVILWLCTPEYVRDTVMPSLRRGWARRENGSEGFAVVLLMPALAAAEPAAAREKVSQYLGEYLRMENYQRLLTAAGYGEDARRHRVGPAMLDALCPIGDGAMIRERMAVYHEIGVTDIAVSPMVDRDSRVADFTATLEAAIGP